jgi:hypothetical protein
MPATRSPAPTSARATCLRRSRDVDAAGDRIENYDLTLRPASPLRSVPIVPVPRGGPIPSGPSGGLRFVAAEAGGSLVANVPGFAAVHVTVKALGQPSVELGPDATDPTKTELRVVGTPAADSIDVRGRSGPVDVVINGVPFGRHAPTGRIVIHGLGGNDTILVGGAFYRRSSWVYGGAGNDQVTTHNGNGVLLGGGDDDLLVSGGARDPLIGGTGANALFARTATTSWSAAGRASTRTSPPSARSWPSGPRPERTRRGSPT